MKTILALGLGVLLASFGLSTSSAENSGTNTGTLPVVTITATDPEAAEPATTSSPGAGTTNTATFVVRRTGVVTNGALAVSYVIGGTASDGVDYALLPGVVTIPLGATSAEIVVRPLADNLVEGNETVILSVMPLADYSTVATNYAIATIRDYVASNSPPTVRIVTPTNGATFQAPATITIAAEATDTNGWITLLELFNGTTRLTAATNGALTFTWANVAAGTYSLRARATDNQGASNLSASVSVAVLSSTPPIPTVTITATDAYASEPVPLLPAVDAGTFTLHRTGDTNADMLVLCALGGTASNGVDYVAIPEAIVIPAGRAEVAVAVVPLADNLVEGRETVTMTVLPVACTAVGSQPTNCYALGISNASATVFINDSPPQTNLPPSVSIFAPANGGTYYATSNLNILVVFLASDPDDKVASVEFFVNTNFMGFATTNLSAGSYWFMWSNVTVGAYTLQARATDSRGASTWSAPSQLTILPQPNTPPIVSITYPTNGTVFTAPANVSVVASASDTNGTVVQVEFFRGTNSLGVQTNNSAGRFYVAWTNVPAGEYSLTAAATDDQSARTVSAPVGIVVRESTPLPVVTITATDATAREIPVVPGGMGMPQEIDPAVFTVARTGSTDAALNVFYTIGGTALNGVDYVQLSNRLSIPAGGISAAINVVPIDDLLVEGNETVVITLQPCTTSGATNTLPSGACYTIGTPASATATILDNDQPTNYPPTVRITTPAAGATFTAPAIIPITASAEDRDDAVLTVEFFAGTNSLGVTTNNPLVMSPINPFFLVWSNVAAGQYILSARATDARGAATVSVPVLVNVLPRVEPSFVTRSLPAWYVPGVKLTARLYAKPATNTTSYTVADRPPANWTVGAISEGGVYDAGNGTVNFGPFSDNAVLALTYEVTPPAAEAGMKEFSGAATAHGASSVIGGTRFILPAPRHPADRNPTNLFVSTEELTAYVSAWKRCGLWPVSPNPIPISYVTRAGFLVQGGGSYTFNTNVPSPYLPLLWVNQNPSPEPMVLTPAENAAGGIWSSNLPGAAVAAMPTNYLPGVAFTVTITVTPASNFTAYAVEDLIPSGWVAANASHDGVFCPTTRKVSWGLFLDGNVRTLTYQVTPPTNSTAIGWFYGTASFDGINRPVTGQRKTVRQLQVDPPTPPVIRPLVPGENLLNFAGLAGANYRVETSTNLVDWVPLETLLNNDGTLQYIDVGATNYGRRFYRAVAE